VINDNLIEETVIIFRKQKRKNLKLGHCVFLFKNLKST